MSKLDGKVAIVSGASKGIGAGIAKALGAAGARVVVNYATSNEGAERVVAEIERGGGRAIAVQGDVSKSADVQRLFAAARRAFDRVDVVVNNAGVFAFQPLEQITEAEFHRQYGINVLGTLLMTQEASKHMGRDGGSIVNIGSVASVSPPPLGALYASTKGALDTLSRGLAVELAPMKIRVNVLAPGGVETEGTHAVGFIGSEFAAQIASTTPLGRLGQPGDIAPVAVFLASDEAAWITGERIVVAGGAR